MAPELSSEGQNSKKPVQLQGQNNYYELVQSNVEQKKYLLLRNY